MQTGSRDSAVDFLDLKERAEDSGKNEYQGAVHYWHLALQENLRDVMKIHRKLTDDVKVSEGNDK